MRYQVIKPSAFLEPYVRFFWVLELDEIEDKSFVHRSMADGKAELIFHYYGKFVEIDKGKHISQPYSMLHGQSQKPRRFETLVKFGIFGAYLYPFTLPKIFGQPSDAFSNEMPDMETLLGAEGRILEEKMILATNNQARVEILSKFLELKIKHNYNKLPDICLAICEVINSTTLIDIANMADQYCMSRRQFERKFKEFSGFSPKLYSRIVRFGNAINEYGNRDKSLTQIGYDCGYYDQSHFIHDFKEFSGYHPKAYFHGKPEGAQYKDW